MADDVKPYTRNELADLMDALIDGSVVWDGMNAEQRQRLCQTARVGLFDTERLDWLEAQKWGHGRGGWEVKPPESGWALQIIPRGPDATLRGAIDRVRTKRSGRADGGGGE